jgi:PadR family transcriptional regulator PadR
VQLDVMAIEHEWSAEFKKGGVQLSIIALLAKGKKYGFQIIKELREKSNGYFDLKEGTLYPALHRLEKRGYLKSEWVTEGDRPPRKYYVLTKKGKMILKSATSEWHQMVESMKNVLE